MCTKLLLILLSAFISSAVAVHVTSCSRGASNNIVQINWINVSPERVTLPGDITLSVSGTLSRPISGNLDADVTISRRFGPMWIDLPCISTAKGRLGSCTYTNICSSLMSNGTRCPRLLADSNIPCTCPVPAGTYTIPQTVFPLDLSSLNIPSIAVAGEYQASLRVTDKTTMTEIICLDVDVEIVEPQRSSMFGNLGRFLVNLFG